MKTSSRKDQIKVLTEEIKELKKYQATLSKQINEKLDKIKSLKEEEERKAEVTDHAVIRYLERIQLLDIEGIRRYILTDQIKETIEIISSGLIPHESGKFKLRVKDKQIVTIVTFDKEK